MMPMRSLYSVRGYRPRQIKFIYTWMKSRFKLSRDLRNRFFDYQSHNSWDSFQSIHLDWLKLKPRQLYLENT